MGSRGTDITGTDDGDFSPHAVFFMAPLSVVLGTHAE